MWQIFATLPKRDTRSRNPGDQTRDQPAANDEDLARESAGQALNFGVADGTRTRDTQDHNLVLYQLNYSHHRCFCSGNYLSPSPCFHKNGW